MMRFPQRYLVVPLLAVGLVSLAALPDRAWAQQAVTIQLAQQSGSGISGTATLTPMGAQTRVVVTVTGAGAGPQPMHIHTGTCVNVNPQPAFPLTSVTNGGSQTTVNVPLSQIQGMAHVILMHKSPTEVPLYVACGNIPVLAATTAAPAPAAAPPARAPAQMPAALPRTGEADYGLYGLLALGALLVTAGVKLLVRRRSI
jgi:LPXTG-motif cell wall-anchored protein